MSEIIQTAIKVPKAESKLCFILDNVFTKEECDEWIRISEEKGYEMALVNIGGGKQIAAEGTRKSDRCIIDSVELADKIYQRITQYLPNEWKGYEKVCLNERLRFLKYHPGGYFVPHLDGQYQRPDGSERSFITVQFYLNEGFEGGETTIFPGNPWVVRHHEGIPVLPKIGRILIFQHDISHEGSLLISGTKYTIRIDVMYRNKPE